MNSSHVMCKVPFSWMKSRDDFLKMGEMCSISFEDARSLMMHNGVEGHNVEEALLFLHEVGDIFWLNEDGLRDVVVLDPFKTFVEPIRVIICNPSSHAKGKTHNECSLEDPDAYNEYKKGKLKKVLLEKLLADWAHNIKEIVSLMLKYGLMVDISNDTYLVPSLLESAQERCSSDTQSSLVIMIFKEGLFSDNKWYVKKDIALVLGVLPPGFFYRIIKALVEGFFNKDVEAFDFRKHYARLEDQHVRFIMRSEKKCLTLEVESTSSELDIVKLVRVVSLVKNTILDVMSECGMNSHELHLLLEFDEILLEYEHARNMILQGTQTKLAGSNTISAEKLLDRYSQWLPAPETSDHTGALENSDRRSKLIIFCFRNLETNLAEMECKAIQGLFCKKNSCFVNLPGDNDLHRHVREEDIQDHVEEGNVFHFIGESINKPIMEDTPYSNIHYSALVNDTLQENMVSLVSDCQLGLNLASYLYNKRIKMKKDVELIFLNMCDKFVFACVVLSKLESDFYVICWYGIVLDEIAKSFAIDFYTHRCLGKDIEESFNAAALLIRSTTSFPCLLRKKLESGSYEMRLVQAGENIGKSIDQNLVEKFHDLIKVNWGSHQPVEPYIPFDSKSHETFRDWSVWEGNKIGFHEMKGLECIGFTMEIDGRRIGESDDTTKIEGRPHKCHKLNKQYKIEDLNEFWEAQKKHNEKLFEKTRWPGGKTRTWRALWQYTVPEIVRKWFDVEILRKCRFHLSKAREYRQDKMLKFSPIGSRAKKHDYQIELLGKSILAVTAQIICIVSLRQIFAKKFIERNLIPTEEANA